MKHFLGVSDYFCNISHEQTLETIDFPVGMILNYIYVMTEGG